LLGTPEQARAAAPATAWIYVTDDSGKTFRPIAVPVGIRKEEDGGPASEQDPLQAITAPDGHIAHLIVSGASTEVGFGRVARWESPDPGRSWKSLAPVERVPPPPPPTATLGGWTLTIRKDGLYRSRGGGPTLRIYPRP